VNEYLRNRGWLVLRYWEHEINANIESVVNEIEEVLSMPEKKTESEHIGGELSKEMETYDLYDKVNLS
jgi:hypothetical protein